MEKDECASVLFRLNNGGPLKRAIGIEFLGLARWCVGGGGG